MSENPSNIADINYQQVGDLQQKADEADERVSSLHESNGQHEINWTDIMDDLKSKQPQKILSALQTVRSKVCSEQNVQSKIDTVIQSGVIPLCVDFLDANNGTELQYEATWILSIIADGRTEQIMTVGNAEAIPKLIVLMRTREEKVAEMATMVLVNICNDGAEFRDRVLDFDVVNILLKLNLDKMKISHLRAVVWLLYSLICLEGDHSILERIKPLIPILIKLVQHEDEEVSRNVYNTIVDVTEKPNGIDLMLDARVAPRLVRLLDSNSTSIVKRSLKIICNFVCGNDKQTSKMLKAGVLQQLQRFLEHSDPIINTDAAHAISNICAGTHEQIDQVLASKILFSIERLLGLREHQSHKDALWVITNIITRGTKKQVIKVIDTSFVIKLYCNHLEHHGENVLKGIIKLFQLADELGKTETKSFRLFIAEIGALDKLRALLNHENEEIRSDASNLVTKYFT